MPNAKWQTVSGSLWDKLSVESRRMRNHPTPAEKALWERLKQNKLGVQFRRQYVFDRFIVDFACLSKKVMVEVDGGVHLDQVERDHERQTFLESHGFHVLRFTNSEVEQNIEAVVKTIGFALVDQGNE